MGVVRIDTERRVSPIEKDVRIRESLLARVAKFGYEIVLLPDHWVDHTGKGIGEIRALDHWDYPNIWTQPPGIALADDKSAHPRLPIVASTKSMRGSEGRSRTDIHSEIFAHVGD